MKKILVTGGAGFIGSNLCEKLVQDDNNIVYSLDNYSTGKEENHVDRVTYIEGDTKNIATLINFPIDTLYHLGEYSRVEQSFEDIEIVWDSNKLGTLSVLEYCRKNTIKIIYAGSSTKFGDGGLGRSQSPYAWSKASNTELVANYGSWFNLPFAIVYFYNVYGNREISSGKYATLIGLFKQKTINNEMLTVVKPGTQKRYFTHINDIIDGLVLVGNSGYGDEFGIGTDESYSIIEIAELFGNDFIMCPERMGNRMDSDVFTEKTKALGWQCHYTVKEHIKEFLEKLRQ